MVGGFGAARHCTATARRALAASWLVLALVLALPAVAAAQPDFTWSGASGLDQNWSDGGNWSGAGAPSGAVGTLGFPACATAGCYQSTNDVSGLSADALSIDDGQPYAISGNPLSLGAGGLTAATTNATVTGTPVLQLPLALSADQTWSVDGSDGGALQVSGALSGTGALGLALAGSATVDVASLSGVDDELGALSVSGSGQLVLGQAGTTTELNATDGSSVSVGGGATLLAAGTGETGPLTLAGGTLQVGDASHSATLAVSGAAGFDSASTLSLFLQHAGTTAGTDYSQLTATGALSLGGAGLSLAAGMCPSLNPGDVDTLVSASSLSGTFADLPDGSIIHFPCSGGVAPAVRINYTATSVTATVLGPTTTSLTATPGAPDTNQAVTLSATVTGASATPAGTVEFENGGVAIAGCSAQALDATGTATCQTAFDAGSSPESLSAIYTAAGASPYLGSTGTLSLAVAQDATSTALAVPAVAVGQGDTYTATVSPADAGAMLPSGQVEFFDGGSPIAGCTAQSLSAGSTSSSATCTVPAFTAPGSHSISASYLGDSDFSGSAATQTLTVSPAATTTSLSASPSSSVTNQGVTLTATVSSAYQTPTGTVAFTSGGATIPGCSAQPLSAGTATCQASFAAAGSPESLAAGYTPDTSTYQASSSGSQSLTVSPDATTTALTAPAATAGQSDTFTATVTPAHTGASTPGGTVAFTDAGNPIAGCSAQPLSGGTATCSITYSTPGQHAITASYGGDANFSGSSGAQSVSVGPAPSTTALAVTPTATETNQPVALTATVAGGDGVPAGTVAFERAVGGLPVPIAGCAAVPLDSSGTASCQTAFAAAGSPEQLSAAYTPAGGSGYAASTSSTVSLPVAKSPSVAFLDAATAVVGQAVTYTVAVAPGQSGPTLPTGPVQFSDDGSPIPGCLAVALVPGTPFATATCTTTYATGGAQHTITASYGGDANFDPVTSNAQPVTVYAEQSSTALSVTPATAVTNQQVTLSATVNPASASGTVSFLNGGAPIAGCDAVTVSGGQASCVSSFAATSSPERLSASFTPSSGAQTAPSASPVTVLGVTPAATSTALAASSSRPSIGQWVAYTATVTPTESGGARPGGSVSFLDDGVPIAGCGARPLGSGGTATCATAYSAAATHAVRAIYSGDGNFAGSSSPSQTVIVPSPPPPAISGVTLQASSVTTTSAVLSAIVDTGGAAVGWQFEYGTKLPYAKATPLQTLAAGRGEVGVKITVKGLAPATLYHFQIVVFTLGSGPSSTAFGRDVTMTTRPLGKVGLLAGRFTVDHRLVRVPLRCASNAACSGRVLITARVAGRTRSCAAARYRLSAHAAGQVTARLSRGCLSLLHHHAGHLHATLTAVPSARQLPVTRGVLIRLR